MTVKEVREIRDELSLRTAGMSEEQRRNFYAEKASKVQKEIDEIRNRKRDTGEISA